MAPRIFFILSAWLCISNEMSKMTLPMCSNFSHLFLTVWVVWATKGKATFTFWGAFSCKQQRSIAHIVENPSNLAMKIRNPGQFRKHEWKVMIGQRDKTEIRKCWKMWVKLHWNPFFFGLILLANNLSPAQGGTFACKWSLEDKPARKD